MESLSPARQCAFLVQRTGVLVKLRAPNGTPIASEKKMNEASGKVEARSENETKRSVRRRVERCAIFFTSISRRPDECAEARELELETELNGCFGDAETIDENSRCRSASRSLSQTKKPLKNRPPLKDPRVTSTTWQLTYPRHDRGT